MIIRELLASDADSYAALRRESLLESPLSFGASAETDFVSSADEVRKQLESGLIILGAFDSGTLIASAGLMRGRHAKSAHKADIWGVYVSPAHRGRGVGRRLLEAVLRRAGDIAGVDIVHIAVTSAAPAARRLYERAGFVGWGTEPDALRHAGQSVDEYHMLLRLR